MWVRDGPGGSVYMEGGQSPKKLLFLQGQSPRQTKKRIPRKPNSKAERAALLHPVRFYLGQRGGAEEGGRCGGGEGGKEGQDMGSSVSPCRELGAALGCLGLEDPGL